MRLERRIDGARPRQEEPDTFLVDERRHGVLLLAAQMHRLATRHEHLQIRACADELGHVGGRGEEVLEVVEVDEQPLVGDVPDHVLGVERLRRRVEHELRVAQRRERHPVHAVGERFGDGARGLQREPCLAAPACARQRQQTRAVEQQRAHLRELSLPTEERRRRHGQVGAVEAPERRKLLVSQLVEPLRRGEVLQPVLAEVAQPLGGRQRGGRGRHDHLAAVRDGCNPRGAVHVGSDVSTAAHEGRPGV